MTRALQRRSWRMRVRDSHALVILGRPAETDRSASQARSLHVGSAAAAGALTDRLQAVLYIKSRQSCPTYTVWR